MSTGKTSELGAARRDRRSRHPSRTRARVIVVGEEIVGWIDYDAESAWREESAVNIGYALFAGARGKGYATRAMALLLGELAAHTDFEAATVLIDPQNVRSLAVARRSGFVERGEIDGQVLLARPLRA